MTPLVFLAIPVVVFVVGSSALWLARWWRNSGEFIMRDTPTDLRGVAPVIRDQREAGWQPTVNDRIVRS